MLCGLCLHPGSPVLPLQGEIPQGAAGAAWLRPLPWAGASHACGGLRAMRFIAWAEPKISLVPWAGASRACSRVELMELPGLEPGLQAAGLASARFFR